LEHYNEPGPSRLAETENHNSVAELEWEGPNSAVEQFNKVTAAEIENPSLLLKDGRSYEIVNFKKESNMVLYDIKVNGYRSADVRTSNKILSVTTENELIASTQRPIIIPEESYVEVLTKARENSFVYDTIEDPEKEGYITGIIFREKDLQ
jgi:hypothetical protein